MLDPLPALSFLYIMKQVKLFLLHDSAEFLITTNTDFLKMLTQCSSRKKSALVLVY